MATPEPLRVHREAVRPEWIDYNGHMNVAYYVLAFDHATDAMYDRLGLDRAYRERTNCSTFAVEMNVSYVREVHEGDALSFATWIVGVDDKRLHYYHEMYHADEGWLAATCELLSLHIDMARRRTVPFPEDIRAGLEAVRAEHAKLPRPERIGRTFGVRAS